MADISKSIAPTFWTKTYKKGSSRSLILSGHADERGRTSSIRKREKMLTRGREIRPKLIAASKVDESSRTTSLGDADGARSEGDIQYCERRPWRRECAPPFDLYDRRGLIQETHCRQVALEDTLNAAHFLKS
jgi:hypothetical protein